MAITKGIRVAAAAPRDLILSVICLRWKPTSRVSYVCLRLVHWTPLRLRVFGQQFASGIHDGVQRSVYVYMSGKHGILLSAHNRRQRSGALLLLPMLLSSCAMQNALSNGGYFMRKPCFAHCNLIRWAMMMMRFPRWHSGCP